MFTLYLRSNQAGCYHCPCEYCALLYIYRSLRQVLLTYTSPLEKANLS